MSILVRFVPPSLTAEQYDKTVSDLEGAGHIPADGMELHVCFGDDPNLRVSEVWESQEKFDAFGEILRPVLQDAGIDPGEPEIISVHNVILP